MVYVVGVEFCADLITYVCDYQPEHEKSALLSQYRNAVRNKVESLNLPRLHYVSGTELLKIPYSLSCDLLHPSSTGMEEIAQNLSAVIRSKIWKL